MIRRRSPLFCTAALVILHVLGPATPRAHAEPHLYIVEADDPRVTNALRAMAEARRLGSGRSATAISLERMGKGYVAETAAAAYRAKSAGLRLESTPPVSTQAFGWTPQGGALTLDMAAHLLHRTMIGPRFEEMTAAQSAGLTTTLNGLLAAKALPPPPGAWVDQAAPDWEHMTEEQINALVEMYLDQQNLIRYWWLERIVNSQTVNMTDSMVLFWHDHFATGADAVFYPMAIYGQIRTFHQYALGNFKSLARAICTDPAMLIWLNGDGNTVDEPNENFAREFLELFTMGEGSGYTQHDVTEAARACTGYVTDGRDVFFVPAWHDNGNKTILGQTGNWGMDELVNIVFQQPATATHICTKLYKYYLDDEPDPADIATLATTMRNNNYAVAPVLSQMFGSQHFFNSTFRGSLIKDVVDLYCGQVRALHASGYNPLTTTNEYERYWFDWQSWDLGQRLTEPPNVAGWPGHHAWINTATLPLRKEYSGMILYGQMWGWPLGFSVDSLAEANRFSNPNNAGALVDDVARLLLGATPSTATRQLMLNALLQGSSPAQWSLAAPGAANKVRDLLQFTMRLPDYQEK